MNSSAVQYKRPIVYGSISKLIGPEDPPAIDPTHSHRWTIYVRGVDGEVLLKVLMAAPFWVQHWPGYYYFTL